MTKTDSEIRTEGYRALAVALGDVAAERFIALIQREPFDYTKWQRNLWPDKTLEEITRAATALRQSTTP